MNSPFFQLKSLSTDTINILLIEDREEDAELTMLALKELSFINQIQWIRDGKEALDFLIRDGKYSVSGEPQPDLILLDPDIPELSGYELLRQIRRSRETQSTPVVIVSNPVNGTSISDMYEAGANSYIPKPVSRERLLEVLSLLGFGISKE